VNQVEAHPYFPNDAIRAYGREHGILTQAWSPLAQGKAISDAVVVAVAERVARTPSQVILRWHIQRGDVVFPKTSSPARMRQNIDVFGFELSPDDVEQLSGLRRGEAGRLGPHPDTFDWVPA
jgi:2,5-diketo-D-gluconate reductase A